jgi:hypothetical protein
MRPVLLWLLGCVGVSAVAAQESAGPPKVIDFAAFSAEPVDAQWSAGMQRRILDELAQMTGLALVGLQVECRSKLCRVQLTVEVRNLAEHGSDRDPAFLVVNQLVAKLGLVWQQHLVSPVVGSTETAVDYLRRGLPIE